jgi:hypothetical protein
MSKENVTKPLKQPDVRRSFIGRLLCKIGWHQFSCKMQDCIDEFGYVPSDGRMPKVAKCSRCGKNYA